MQPLHRGKPHTLSFTLQIGNANILRVAGYCPFADFAHWRCVDSTANKSLNNYQLTLQQELKHHEDTLQRRRAVQAVGIPLNFYIPLPQGRGPRAMCFADVSDRCVITFSQLQKSACFKTLIPPPTSSSRNPPQNSENATRYQQLPHVQWVGCHQSIAYLWSIQHKQMERFNMEAGSFLDSLKISLPTQGKPSEADHKNLHSMKESFVASSQFLFRGNELCIVTRTGQIFHFLLGSKGLYPSKFLQLKPAPTTPPTCSLIESEAKEGMQLFVDQWLISLNKEVTIKKCDPNTIQKTTAEAPPNCFYETISKENQMMLSARSVTANGLLCHWEKPLHHHENDPTDPYCVVFKSDKQFVATVTRYGHAEFGFPPHVEAFDRKKGTKVFQYLQCEELRSMNSFWLSKGILSICTVANEVICWDLNAGRGCKLGMLHKNLPWESNSYTVVEVLALSERKICVLEILTDVKGNRYTRVVNYEAPLGLPTPLPRGSKKRKR